MSSHLLCASVLLIPVFCVSAASKTQEKATTAEAMAKACATEPGEAGVEACEKAFQLGYFDRRPLPPSPEAHDRLGQALNRLGKFEEACRVYREMIRLAPQSPLGHYRLGALLLHRLDRAEEAIGPLLEATRLDPSDAAAQLGLGTAEAWIGRHREAVEHLAAAVGLAPEKGCAHERLAESLLAMGRADEAVTQYRIATQSVRNPGFAYWGLGRSLLHLGRVEEAAETFRTAIEKEPLLAEAYGDLGVALNQLGQFKEAVESLEKAERVDRNYFARYPERLSVLELSRKGEQRKPND